MESQFNLDGTHVLRIRSNAVRHAGDPRSVSLQIDYTPLRLPGDPEPEEDKACSSNQLPVPRGTRVLMSKQFTPSEARAVASSLLSAATEARG